MKNIAVKTSGVNKGFGQGESRTEVLKEVDFEACMGELLMLVGPSGCGKTTLLSVIAGTLATDRGEVEVFDAPLHRLDKKAVTQFRAANIGFIFQQYNLIPTLNCIENVSVPLRIQGATAAVAEKKAAEMLETVGLGKRMHHRPNMLSGGQQQRVAIARALVHEPKLIICDEPTAALDSENGQKVMEILKKATFYLALAGIGATAVMASRMSSTQAETPPPIEPSPKPYAISVAASGIIEALSENVSIGVPEAGLVTKVHVKVWDAIREGQPLFTLDDRELTAQLAVNEANAAVAEATLRRLQDQLGRFKGVNDPRAVSQDEVRTKEHDVAVAAAQLEAARAQVAQNKVSLERRIVVAPRAGTILQVNIRAGEYASATPKTAAMVLGDVDHLQVRADVDEQNASRLQAGQTATAYLKGDTTEPIELSFVRIEPYVVPKTSLTGASTERVDTRVLQVIYSFERPQNRPVYVGQQVDMFVKSEVPELQAVIRQRAQAEHALAVLCGQPPEDFSVTARPSIGAPPEIPAGLPSSLLERRPDIVEAEQRLQAESARIGVAKAAFFPTIKLTSTAGLASADLGTFFTGASRVWSVGPSIHIPLFEGGRNQANLKAAQARYEQAVAGYRGTILNAFREVEDSLSDLSTLASQSEAVNRAVVAARDTATLANERYQRGLSNYLDVVDAQRTALQAERQETLLRGQRAISTILLAKALGGGWERP